MYVDVVLLTTIFTSCVDGCSPCVCELLTVRHCALCFFLVPVQSSHDVGRVNPPEEQPGGPQEPRQSSRTSLGQTQVAKTLSELDIMRANMAVLNEMMAEIEPGDQTGGEQDLMYQLSVILKEMQKRIGRLCQKVQDDLLLCE